MKNTSSAYNAKETATKRKPVELFHFYDNNTINGRYTSGDVAITYAGETWEPAPLSRTALEYNTDFEASELTITLDYLHPEITRFISLNPPETVWVDVLKMHRDYTTEADVIFVGEISTVIMKGIAAQAKVIGFEKYLNRPACVYRYQRVCNYDVGDPDTCKVDLDNYDASYTVNAESSDGKTLTLSGSGPSNGAFTLGYIKNQADSERRMIVSHIGTEYKIRYKFSASVDGETCTLYQGCDKTIETCRDKFNNVVNYFGFPYIPSDNPAARSLI